MSLVSFRKHVARYNFNIIYIRQILLSQSFYCLSTYQCSCMLINFCRLFPDTASVDSVINDFYALHDSIPALDDIVDMIAFDFFCRIFVGDMDIVEAGFLMVAQMLTMEESTLNSIRLNSSRRRLISYHRTRGIENS
jgi:hypothetical protein